MTIEPTTVVRYPAIESRVLLRQSTQNTATKGEDWYVYYYLRVDEARHTSTKSLTIKQTSASQPKAFISNTLTHSAPPERTLGERLRTLRAQIIRSGEPLLDWDQLEEELAERRGER
jgi:hypothetical protein